MRSLLPSLRFSGGTGWIWEYLEGSGRIYEELGGFSWSGHILVRLQSMKILEDQGDTWKIKLNMRIKRKIQKGITTGTGSIISDESNKIPEKLKPIITIQLDSRPIPQ